MRNVAVIGDLSSGHDTFQTPQNSYSLTPSILKINGRKVMTEGTPFGPHSDGNSVHTGSMGEGSRILKVNGKRVALDGHNLGLGCGGSVRANSQRIMKVSE